MNRSAFRLLLLLLPLGAAGHGLPGGSDTLLRRPPLAAEAAPAVDTGAALADNTGAAPSAAAEIARAACDPDSGQADRTAGREHGHSDREHDHSDREHGRERGPLDRRIHNCREGWRRAIPTHVKLQYAGGMGFLSFGAGWDYGRRCQWETDLFLGFLPRSKADCFHITATVKQNYLPWSIACGSRTAIEPFCCGMYVNTIMGEKFWVREPDRYPRKYYTFSTKVHTFFFIGQRFTLRTGLNTRSQLKAVTAYYELSTCDLYLISAAANRSLNGWDIIGLSFGLKLQLF